MTDKLAARLREIADSNLAQSCWLGPQTFSEVIREAAQALDDERARVIEECARVCEEVGESRKADVGYPVAGYQDSADHIRSLPRAEAPINDKDESYENK